jgi:hypothetical protein
LEFFIKRVAEEEQRTGIRLLDVIDLHFYPTSSVASNVVQYHRVFFDSTYIFPEANGVKVINGGWDNSIQIEDIFGRCQNWLNQYMGPDNGVHFAVSETATQLQNDPNSLAVWYASMMGEFMNHGVEYFSPWSWSIGMWETLHLFSRYNKSNSVQATSSDELEVSAYASVDNGNDSLTVALVNRSPTQSKTVALNFPNFALSSRAVTSLTLANLPTGTETFISHTNNALTLGSISPQTNNTLQITLSPMSITSLLIAGAATTLPINLLSFTGSKNNQGVLLNFSLTNDLTLDSIEIERSPDGIGFTQIGTVLASAADTSSGGEQAFSFTDNQPLAALNYYRLKMVDQNGSFSYSGTISIRYTDSSFVAIAPNPAKDAVTIQLHMPAGTIHLQLIDALGRTVRVLTIQSSGNILSVPVDISTLAAGLYYFRAGTEVLSFIKL